MDSLIHYKPADVVRVLAGMAARTGDSMLFTFAPSSAFLQAFLAVGRLVPRGDRSPAIVPVAEHKLRRRIEADPAFQGWRTARTHRVARGFDVAGAGGAAGIERIAFQDERYPQCWNQARASSGVMASRAAGKASSMVSIVLGATARNLAFSLDQASSIGFRSGE